MEIWLEEVFISNAIMNFVVLLLIKNLLSIKATSLQIAMAVLFASVIGMFFPILEVSGFLLFVIKTVFAIGIVLIAFPFSTFVRFGACMCSFLFITSLLGGVSFGVMQAIQSSYPSLYNEIEGHSILLAIVYALGILSYFMVKNLLVYAKQRMYKSKHEFQVVLHSNNQSTETSAFLDSGNCLKDPQTNKPILIISSQVFEKLFGTRALIDFYRKQYDKLQLVNPHFVKANGVGKSENLLAFELSKLCIQTEFEIKEIVSPIAAITLQSLAPLQCRCILNPQMLF